MNSLRIFALLFLLAAFPAVAAGADTDEGATQVEPTDWSIKDWQVQFSFYTKHFDPDPEHVNDQNLIGVEAIFENDWLAGVAIFDNSFGQPSQFAFVGKRWALFQSEHWYVKLMGGLLHGYKDEYQDKIPLNDLGVAPAVVPALGFRYRRLVIETNLGGLAVVTMTAGIRF